MNRFAENPSFDLPFAYRQEHPTGTLRRRPEDFQVEEQLGFEPEGEGEHVFLLVQKTGLNTVEVAGQIAAAAGVAPQQVSFSGLKDKQAVTRQWFSIHLPGAKSREWTDWDAPGVKVIRQSQHRKKLRRGTHRSNHFKIRIDQIVGDTDQLEATLQRIRAEGVPNYFGEQRFGFNGANLNQAEAWFNGRLRPGRQKKSLMLSAVRSYLFNQVLAQRVETGSWCKVLEGELCLLDGSNSVFLSDPGELENLSVRAGEGDIHPSGPLFGREGKLSPRGVVAQIEQAVLAAEPQLLQGLERNGVQAQRRSLRVLPRQLDWSLNHGSGEAVLELEFSLPSGCFATAVVRELVCYHTAPTGAAN